ncbi:MAG: ribonuclease domain-containing protein [Fibrobacter sp.]|nr:ribonuclease domain-containing protein [Fibrobacter sp.]MDY6369430.1 ribonuclease domain-containing protein [Fibrobacter sp.]MDY6390412.1 ribonuclease domain-containing protein [Fibrobacter sp.]
MKNLKISFALLLSAFFVACSSPTIPNNDSSETELSSSSSRGKSSNSGLASSSSSEKSLSSNSQESVSSSSDEMDSSSSQRIDSSSSESQSSNSSATSSSSESIESSSSVDIYDIYEAVEESGVYTTKDSVAAYLCKFDKLPSNYVGKNEGKDLYESSTGNTFSKWNFNPWTTIGVMIGGDDFNNYASDPDYYHENLPEGSYSEADVDYSGSNRGTKRLIYQSGCIIYYTADHYETFDLLSISQYTL